VDLLQAAGSAPSEAGADPDDEQQEDCLTAFEERQLYQVLDLHGLIRELTGLIDFHPR
jgi:hypothetical protein